MEGLFSPGIAYFRIPPRLPDNWDSRSFVPFHIYACGIRRPSADTTFPTPFGDRASIAGGKGCSRQESPRFANGCASSAMCRGVRWTHSRLIIDAD